MVHLYHGLVVVGNTVDRLYMAVEHLDMDLVDSHEDLGTDLELIEGDAAAHMERLMAVSLEYCLKDPYDDMHAPDHLLRREVVGTAILALLEDILLHARCTTLQSDESPR